MTKETMKPMLPYKAWRLCWGNSEMAAKDAYAKAESLHGKLTSALAWASRWKRYAMRIRRHNIRETKWLLRNLTREKEEREKLAAWVDELAAVVDVYRGVEDSLSLAMWGKSGETCACSICVRASAILGVVRHLAAEKERLEGSHRIHSAYGALRERELNEANEAVLDLGYTLTQERSKAQREVTRLQEALVRYAEHLSECSYLHGGGTCPCGLEAALTVKEVRS